MARELLERDAEVAAIGRLVSQARSGSGALLVVEGSAGCGKTRLLAEARSLAERSGVRTLWGRGGELERGFPFGVARQLFEPLLAAAPATERRRLLEGAAAQALPALGLDAARDGAAASDGLFRALHGLYWLTVNIADAAPLLIVVDDLHWTDALTVRWLGYLLRRVDGLPVIIATAIRSGEPDSDALLLESITGHDRATTLRPAALTVNAVAALVSERLGPGAPAFAAACHHATAGNPFMLGELLGALAADEVAPDAAGAERIDALGPATVARSIFLRLGRLARGADRLARAVAVLGLDAELRHAAALADLDERAAATAADALSAAAILASGRPLEFVHPVVRAAIYNELPPQARALAHRDAARLLAGEGADAQRVAAHLRLCQPAGDPEAVHFLRLAARAALARGASTEAIADLSRALEEPPPVDLRGELLVELGVAERHANDAAAVGHLELAAEASTDHRARCGALRELSMALMAAGRMSESVDAADRALQALEGRDEDIARQIEAELIAAGQMGMLAGYSARDRLARRDAAGVDSHTPGGRMLLAVLAFEAIRTARPALEAAMLAERALGAGADREPVADSPPRYLGLLALLYAERYEQVYDRCAAELAAVRKRGSVSGFATVSLVLADLAYRRGRLTDAESHAQAVLALEGIESPIFHGVALGTLVVCMLERGAHDTAAVTLTAAGVDALAPELLLHSLLLARGELKVARGDARAGLDDIESCGRLLQAAGHHNSASVPWRPAAAMVHAALGARAESERLVDEELRHARAFGAPRVLGIALRVASLVHGGQAGLALLEEAVSVLASSPAQLEYARALTDLGAARRRSGHRVDAREPLRHAIELAHECDATVLAARAREELIAAGARPRRVARSGIRSLTPSERRVAELASRGLGNPGIAQALFVTVKTVETHLGHVYTKLGINTREALPKKLADAVPAPSTSDDMPSRHRRA